MKTKFTKTSVVLIALAIFTLNMSSCKDELPKIIEEGTTGSLLWKFTDDGVLIISGIGRMPDYKYDYELQLTNTPWYSYRDAIKTVVIHNGVISIGNRAFAGCSYLSSATIPNSVISIGDYAFSSCIGLTSINIPDSITSIGVQTFSNCYKLKEITFPSSIANIGNWAFLNCYTLKRITLPNSLEIIENYAFVNCSGLENIIIPNNVESIGTAAFVNCSGLKNVIISNNVKRIGGIAFAGCSGLTEMVVKAMVPPIIDSNIFDFLTVVGSEVNHNISVYVPQESLELYKNAKVWKELNLQGKVF